MLQLKKQGLRSVFVRGSFLHKIGLAAHPLQNGGRGGREGKPA